MVDNPDFRSDGFALQQINDYREICIRIAKLAIEAGEFPASGHAGYMMSQIVGYARRANAISGHGMTNGGYFMDGKGNDWNFALHAMSAKAAAQLVRAAQGIVTEGGDGVAGSGPKD